MRSAGRLIQSTRPFLPVFRSRGIAILSLRSRLLLIALLAVSPLAATPAGADDLATAREMFFKGQFAKCIEQSEQAINRGDTDEDWFLLKAQAELASGQYRQAVASVDEGLEENPNSIRLRWLGRDAYRRNSDTMRAKELLNEMEDLINYRRWRYRSSPNQVAIARFLIDAGADARKVLDEVLLPAARKDPQNAETFLAIADLAMSKYDYAMAAEYFRQVTELQPANPAGFTGLARAFQPSDSAQAEQALQRAFHINQNDVAAMLFAVDGHINAEAYAKAEELIEKILSVDAAHSAALAYRAVIAHLTNQPQQEDAYRKQALASWDADPQIDHLIGRKLSQKYRFAEGARYQRRSLVYDPDYLPAKMQLANDLLRLGNERQGWKLVDEVYAEDGYNVVAHNLVTLGNHMEEFTTLERDGFLVRMAADEAVIYGPRVLELLGEAKQTLCEKYDIAIQLPVIVEIFPQQQDFAIRTFGLPGGAGFLGVCFGRVITMNSPASQGETPSNWQSVLWHEFCHVVTLQKTKNKMPRWLSEGISVYEEMQRHSGWGQAMTPRFRAMILEGELTPVSQLSGAFLNPSSSEHLQFAYFESSLVVQYIVEKYGHEVLLKILDDLRVGMHINEVLGRYMGNVKLLDKEFAAFAREQAKTVAPAAEWQVPELTAAAPVNEWREWTEQHPQSFPGLLGYAVRLIQEEDWKAAQAPLEKLIELYPDYRGPNNPYVLLSRVSRELGDTSRERELLEKAASLQSDRQSVYQRLCEIYIDEKQWAEAAQAGEQLLAINPLSAANQRTVLHVAESAGNHRRTVEAAQSLLHMDPMDPADLHFRLAVAQRELGDLEAAKRQLLQCLEEAPRYLDAHQLLLAVIQEMEESEIKESDADEASRDDSDSLIEDGKH